MGFNERDGKRSKRKSNRRIPDLGYYIIVTDTTGTEKIYLNGLRDSIGDKYKDRLIIKVKESNDQNMVKEALKIANMHPQYAQPWIVFDKDKNKDFDKIIHNAEEAGIKVAWSNPCIEIWFHAYFGTMPNCNDSTDCVRKFKREFLNRIGHEYSKTDKNLYSKMFANGDETTAIEISKQKMREHLDRRCDAPPSEMTPCSNMHALIEEVRNKIKK